MKGLILAAAVFLAILLVVPNASSEQLRYYSPAPFEFRVNTLVCNQPEGIAQYFGMQEHAFLGEIPVPYPSGCQTLGDGFFGSAVYAGTFENEHVTVDILKLYIWENPSEGLLYPVYKYGYGEVRKKINLSAQIKATFL